MQEFLAGGLRLAGLSMRMVLALFMARYLTFADIGVFSLLVGLTGLLPGAAGLGLSYFVNRDVVGMPPQRAELRARDRLIVTMVCGVVSSAGLALLVLVGRVNLPVSPWICAALVTIEMVGFDLHLLLIARRRTTAANFLLFMRSAFWIPVFMALAYIWPSFRGIGPLIATWLAGLLLYLFIVAFVLRRTFLSASFWITKFDGVWLRSTLRRAIMVWVSDFALALAQNSDRFIISSVLGVAAAGVYYFYFSIANAAFLVVQSATTQPYMPRIRSLFVSHDNKNFIITARQCLSKLIRLALITFILAELGTVILSRLLARPELMAQWLIMPIILIGMMGKAIADYLGIIDYIMERDKRFITINVFSFVMVIATVGVMTTILGILGAALGMAITTIIFAATRWIIWQREVRHLRAETGVKSL